MTAPRLSEAQRRVLTQLVQSSGTRKGLRTKGSMLWRMRDQGLVEPWNATRWRITEAGRRALREPQNG